MEREKRPPLIVPVCKDFTRGRCTRSELECRYVHPTSAMSTETTPEGDIVTVCFDSLRNRCTRGPTCRFLHPPPQMLPGLLEKAGISMSPPSKIDIRVVDYSSPPPQFHPPFVGLPGALIGPPRTPPRDSLGVRNISRPALEVCRDFVRGRCARDASECRYAHTQPTSGDTSLVTVCQDFLKGRCEREMCRYFHPPNHLKSRIREIPTNGAVSSPTPLGPSRLISGVGSPVRGMGSPPPSLIPDRERMNAAAYQAAYNAYAASLYEQQAAAKRMRLEEERAAAAGGLFGLDYASMDRFRKTPDLGLTGFGIGGALGSPGSLYLREHLAPHLASTSLSSTQTTASTLDVDKMLVCRDFLRGKCVRIPCRFVHPPAHVLVADNHVTICRDALHGRCVRDLCRFYHPPPRVSPGISF